MKSKANILSLILFPLGYAAMISLGAVCFLNVAVITLSPFGGTGSYPRFVPFCVLAGMAALVLCLLFLALHARHLLNHDTHLRRKIVLEVALTLLLTLPGMWMWDNLLTWLQRIL